MHNSSKILTIEDEPHVRSGIVAYLEDSGFEMLEAEDGRSGLELFRREHPDIVLCDLCLPEIDGLDVLSTITRESPQTPVIIVSGAGLMGHVIQALKRGAWDYITKPIENMEVLENAVHKVADRAELIRQNQEYREHLEALNIRLRETVDRLQQDEEAGRQMQCQLLPEASKTFGDYTFSQRLYPSTYLSGDFLDYFAIDTHRIGFYIADVSGHGTASAFVTVMLKILIDQHRNAYLQEGEETVLYPERILHYLNRELCRHPFDKYLTMFYGVLDMGQNTLVCASGGLFPHPVLFDGDQARFLACQGFPIGLFEEASYQTQRIGLPEEFALMMVSDGILEVLPQVSLKEKRSKLISLIGNIAVDLDELITTLKLVERDDLPDDITFLLVTKQTDYGKR